MTFRRLITAITFLAILTMALRVSVDTDTWWHLRAGAWMIEEGKILRSDPFSYTRGGEAWVYPGWLAQIILYGIYTLAGFAGLNLFTALMVLMAFAFVWSVMEAPVHLRAFVILLAVTVSGVYWAARPHIISFLLTGIFFWALERFRGGQRGAVMLLPPLMALWANMHGGFAIGFLLLFAYVAAQFAEMLWSVLKHKLDLKAAWRQGRRDLAWLGSVTGLSALGVGINPHGLQMLAYPLQTISIGVLQDFIQEWQSPDFHALHVQPFLWMLLLIMIAWAYSKREVRPNELFLVLGFAYLAMMAGRNIALFALVGAPSLARHAEGALAPHLRLRLRPDSAYHRRQRVLNLLLFAVLVIAAGVKISLPLSPETNEEAVRGQAPVDAVDELERLEPGAPVFNSYNWGGYFIWRLYPRYKTFVDGRTDLFDDEILQDYLLVWRADPGWQDVFARWGVQTVLIEADAPLVDALEPPGWQQLYADDRAVLISRSP